MITCPIPVSYSMLYWHDGGRPVCLYDYLSYTSVIKYAVLTRWQSPSTSVLYQCHCPLHIHIENTGIVYTHWYLLQERFIITESLIADYEDILTGLLDGVTYDVGGVRHLCKSISDAMKSRTKALNIPRYKIVVHVTIGEVGSHSLLQASRCMWNTDMDTHCTVEYKNQSLYACATIYVIYVD